MNFIKRNFISVWLVFILVLFWWIVPPYVNAKDTCIDCHKNIKLEVQNKKLIDYYRDWENSTHDLAGIICIDCHGGNPTKTDKEAAHSGEFTSFLANSKESFKVLDRCGKCHKVVLKNFVESKHYKEIHEKDSGPNCVTCHGSMNTGVYEAHNVGKGCEVCHNEETKNIPEIGQVAEKVLHNINILRVYLEWLSNHSIFNEKHRKSLITQYQDIVKSWHTFNFKQIESKTEKPLNDARRFTKEELSES